MGAGKTVEQWDEWTAKMRAAHSNGNGHGRSLAIEAARLTSSAEASPASPHPTPASGREPTTNGGSGPSSPVWLASYDPDTSSWRTSQVSLLSTEDERFPRSSETWPRWGTTRRGEAFALPTPERPTAGSGSSSSLNIPTPTAPDAIWADKGHSRRGIVGNHNLGLVDWARTLLPTPAARDYKDTPRMALEATNPDGTDRDRTDLLPKRIYSLLPTPTGDDANNVTRASGEYRSLAREVHQASLGEPTNPPSDAGSE